MMTKTKIVLEKEFIPQVELDFMNNTHFEEIKMVKELGELINTFLSNKDPQTQQAISQKLVSWQSHTLAHFDRENKLMQETDFPAYPVHKNEHDLALERTNEIVKAWNDNQDIELLEDYTFTLWPKWFEQHVNTMDMITAKFAVMNGYKNH